MSVFVLHGVAFRPQLIQCGIYIDGVPQHNHVENQTECAQLVFLALAIILVSVGSSLVAIWASPGGGGGGGDWAGAGCATKKTSATTPASSEALRPRRDWHGRSIVTGSRLGLQCTSMTVVCGGSNEADDLPFREVCANAAIATPFRHIVDHVCFIVQPSPAENKLIPPDRQLDRLAWKVSLAVTCP